MGESIKIFDVIILGDGAGLSLAKNLAKFGFKTALIGHGRPGGTCLNRGCIPSKKLIAPIFKIYSSIHNLKKINNDKVEKLKVKDFISIEDLKKDIFKDIYSDSINSKKNMESSNIKNLTYFSSHAKFVDDNTLKLESNEILNANKIVIATGSNPRIPTEIKGIGNVEYDTSTEALFSQEKFDEYTILGGGVIACELGAVYAAYGVKVTILATSGILRVIDESLKKDTEKYLESLGINIVKQAKIKEIKNTITSDKKDNEDSENNDTNDNKIEISFSQEKQSRKHTTSRLLVAMGISPNTTEIDIENTSAQVTHRGFIQTDENYKINDSLYAIGDCSGKSLLRHGAGFEAREVFKQLIEEKLKKSYQHISQEHMPAGIYLGECEVASCGKTAFQLKQQGREFKTFEKKFNQTIYGKAKQLKGKIVIHYDSHSFEMLGSHIFGEDAVNLNQVLVPYIEQKKTLFELSDTISPHPSLIEGLVTIPIREIVSDYWLKEKE